MHRRSWLKVGVFGAALVALGGTALVLVRPGWADGRLTPAGRELFAAVARGVLDGLLPDPAAEADAHRRALADHLDRLQATIAGLPPVTQAEIAQLAALLLHPAGRFALTGLTTDWAQADASALRETLQALRHSRLALRQQVFHALRDLTNGAWFADPAAWPAIGYPGPRDV